MRAIRILQGLSQRELARRIGRSAAYVARVESGVRGISRSGLVEVADGLAVPVGAISSDELDAS